MKNSILLTSIATILGMSLAEATTVGFSPVPTAREIVSEAGVRVAATSLVLVGNFLNEAWDLNKSLTLEANFTAISTLGGWKAFGRDTVTGAPNDNVAGTLSINASGKLGGAVTDNNTGATKADYFNGKNLYVWIFNASTIQASTEMGIFKAATATVPWAFPTNGGGIGDSITLSTTASGATIVPAGASELVGSVVGSQLKLEAIPEPSSALLCGLGALAMAGRRRRVRL